MVPDQSQPSCDARDRLSEIVARCKADGVDAAILVPIAPSATRASVWPRACWRRTASPPLSWVARRISSSTWACRGFCSPISRSVMGGPPEGSRVAGLDARACPERPRGSAGSADHCAVPLKWSASPDWKLDYCNIERLTPEEIRHRPREFDKGKTEAKNVREKAGVTRPLRRMNRMTEIDRPKNYSTMYRASSPCETGISCQKTLRMPPKPAGNMTPERSAVGS